MKTEHTLRYLLLRHLEPFEAVVPETLFREVTASLHVEDERGGWRVSWQGHGEPHEKRFERDAFTFYRRADTRPDERSLDDALGNENDRRARAFAEAAMGRPSPLREPTAPVTLDPAWRRSVLFDGAFAAGLASLGGLGLATGALILAVCLSEYLRFGRLAASAGFVLLAGSGPAAAALAGALAYGALQLLDPDAGARRSRIALCAAAVALAAASLAAAAPPPDLAWGAGLAAAVIGLGLAVTRSLHAIHFRALPLALPFYCIGLAFEGHVAAAGTGLAVLASALLVGISRSPR